MKLLELEKKELDDILWRIHFGRGYGIAVRYALLLNE